MERLVCIFFFSADDCKNFKVNSSAIVRYFLSLQKIGCAWVLYAFFLCNICIACSVSIARITVSVPGREYGGFLNLRQVCIRTG